MNWGAYSASGKADLVVMEEKDNSARYINVLEKVFPIINHLDTNNAIFQQDNAAIHKTKLTKDWFKTKCIKVLDWPTKYPDSNLIENFSRRVYKSTHQFEYRKTLKSCIKQYWNEIHLKISENVSIQSKTSVLKFYN